MERVRKLAIVTGLALALVSGVARADQVLGVTVYRKSELLPLKSAFVKTAVGGDAGCYRTADSLEAVRAYYSRMPGFVSPEPNVLRRGSVDVVLHPPSADPRTGVPGRYTVFCIMQATQ